MKKSEKIINKRVGIWIRVSTEDQARGDSPEHHEKRARNYAEGRGWDVKEVYHLEAVSGKSILYHPEAKRMLADIRSGHISGIIFSKLARLARNTRELLEIADIFEKEGADLISLHEAIDTSTPAGRLFYTMFAAMAQWEREEIADRVAASIPIRAKMGKSLGGKAPLGYSWDNNQLVLNQEEVPVVKKVFELYKEHKRKKVVVKLLNEGGYRTRENGLFSDTTINRMLRSSVYVGKRLSNYTKWIGDKQKTVKPESEWVYADSPQIIDENLWSTCQNILSQQGKKTMPSGRRTTTLFAGFVFCQCGEKMYVRTKSDKYICEKCRNKIPLEDLEEIFFEELKNYFLSPEDTARYLESADHKLKDKIQLLSQLEKETISLRKEMDKVYNLYVKDELTPRGFGERYKPMEERLGQIEEEMVQLQSEIDYLRISYLSSDQILTEAKNLYTHWKELTFEEKRSLVEHITEKIIVFKDEIEINLCYLPPSEDVTKKQRNLAPTFFHKIFKHKHLHISSTFNSRI